jgi:type II secretory pathway pseudopilin PulG
MYCSACGAAISNDTRFCPSCGAAVQPEAAAPAPTVKLERTIAVTLLAVLKIAGAGLWLLFSVVWFFLAREPQAGPAVVFTAFAVLALVMSVACALCAYGLWNLRPFGRVLQIVLSCFGLLAFPLGTIISALILVYMFRPGIRVLFSGRVADALSREEVGHVQALDRSPMATVIVVVVAVAFLAVPMAGIVSAIAIPNLLNAVDRGKQKRTMADVRAIATAVEAFAVDHNAYPVADSVEDLARQISPVYLETVPLRDGWSRPFQVQSRAEGYLIYSQGKDGTGETCDDGQTNSFNDEICFADGDFVRYPAGTQR